jgi:hypothetical protein
MDGIIPLPDTQHPRKAVALELWAGDCRESSLGVLGYLSNA